MCILDLHPPQLGSSNLVVYYRLLILYLNIYNVAHIIFAAGSQPRNATQLGIT
jgi:hypothetical protein